MKKKLLSYALVGSLAAGGLGGAIFAQTSQPPVQKPSYTGSVAVQQDPNGGASEAQEAQQYASLAKVSEQEAIAAAQQASGLSAQPSKVALENENGYLVWEVVIGDQEIKVDAGTAQVLHSDLVGNEDPNDPAESGDPD